MVTPASSRILIIILAAITALGPMSMQIFLPALPAIQDAFSVSPGRAQLVLSSSLIAIAIASLAYGPASDRFGRRPVMVIGLAIFLIGSVICAVAPSIWILILGRVVQAIGGAAGMVLSRAIIRDLFDRETAAKMLAYMVTALVMAPMVAPLIGGVLNDFTGWRSIFVFTGIVGLAALALAYPRVPETREQPVRDQSLGGMLLSFISLLRIPAFLGYAGQLSFGLGMFMAFIGGAPFVVVRVLNRPPTELGVLLLIISAGFMLGTFITARIAGRVGVDRMILVGSVLSVIFGLIMVVLVLAGQWTVWAIFLPGAGMAFANGLIMPNAQAAAVSINPRIAGSASGLMSFMQMSTGAIFAQAVGIVQDGTPVPMVIVVTLAAVLGLVSIVFLPRLGRRA
ncbi:MAG: Bcr/CflA family efflux MFS transporter [Alphaproteobacteria bacterium]|nr:Bcr/CflA family efflux MFS transporter [Alphaproteobacteria bacterium]